MYQCYYAFLSELEILFLARTLCKNLTLNHEMSHDLNT